MRNKAVTAVLVVLMTLVTVTVVQAELYRINFDARTTRTWADNTTLTDTMSFWIEAYDTALKNPPDFVQSITITAPNGTKYSVPLVSSWSYIDKGYGMNLEPISLGSASFQPGTYTVAVKAAAVTLTATDTVSPLVWLSAPTLTYPLDGAKGVPEQALLKWSATVPKADRYGIYIWNNTKNQPVLTSYPGMDAISTTTTHFKLPKGVLRPKTEYSLQIQARGNLQDTDCRASSKSIIFTTGSW